MPNSFKYIKSGLTSPAQEKSFVEKKDFVNSDMINLIAPLLYFNMIIA